MNPLTTSAGTTHGPAQAGPARRNRRTGLVAGVVLLTLVATACFPTGPVEEWVPDFNGDGRIDESEVDRQKAELIRQASEALEAHRRQVQRHPFLTCVRRHESDRGAYPHINGYAAQNPYSSASGAYQFIDSTWRNVSAKAGHAGYSKASQAPWFVQDAVALYLYDNGGRSAWAGTGC